MNKDVSFEDSLRQSQLPPTKKKPTQQVKFTEEEIKIIDLLQPKQQIQQQPPKIANGKLDFIFNAARDINMAKAYHEDGDENMYSEENITKRRKLKSHPEVISAIEKFMGHYKMENNKLVRDQYLKIHVRLAHLLRDDLSEDVEDLKFLLLEDWDHDSHGKGNMNQADLYDSLFELVDTWTPDADKDQYVGFFELLEERYSHQSEEKFEKLFYEIIE